MPILSYRRTTLALALSPWAAAQATPQQTGAAGRTPSGSGKPDEKKAVSLSQVIVTAVPPEAVSVMGSSVSVSTLDATQLQQSGAQSASGVLRDIPGIRAESSGGDGNANISVRGLPEASGGAKYVQYQIDGMPVLEFGDIAFATPDTFIRPDYNLRSIEVVRGGSSSIFASNAPGAIINFITKTGRHKGGAVGLTYGLGTYDTSRLDFDYGGPIDSTTRYHIGGFIHSGQGQKPVGYTAQQGGQFMGNITHDIGDAAHPMPMVRGHEDDSAGGRMSSIPDATTSTDADYAMRNWQGAESGRIAIGSDAHKRLFCRMLLDTHNPYKPAIMVWPKLAQDALQRITSLPIWDIAVQTEGRAMLRARAYADTVRDPLLHEALSMDAGEEARHKVVLSHLVQSYGIALEPEPEYEMPEDPEWDWLVTGYSECIDSFFGFGLFESAKRTGYFPAELVDTFEPVIQEEVRHILFFANWVAWYRRQLPWWRRSAFRFRELRVWAFLVWERIGIAKGLDGKGHVQDANFALSGGKQINDEIKVGELLQMCLIENDRRMAGYDQRLLRPTFVPRMARLARAFLR